MSSLPRVIWVWSTSNNAKGNEQNCIPEVSLSYYGSKVFIVYLRSLFCTGALVARAAKQRRDFLALAMAAAISGNRRLRRIAKYGKCSSTMAHLSNSGNKNQAKLLIASSNSPWLLCEWIVLNVQSCMVQCFNTVYVQRCAPLYLNNKINSW